jgi:hypothetical protein
MTALRTRLAAFVFLWFIGISCAGDVPPPPVTTIDLGCTTEGCPCVDDGSCGAGLYCHDLRKTCDPTVCTPDRAFCDNDAVYHCNGRGSAFTSQQTCASGSCQGGQCTCTTGEDCFPGESCVGGICDCPSQISCGSNLECCPVGHSCERREICDGNNNCFEASRCTAPCDGQRCGLAGDVCCTGNTPVCGPLNTCIADCGSPQRLCGENFDRCCPDGELCVFGECRAPGGACTRFTDCDFGEYCEPALSKCMPLDFPEGIECREEGEFDELQVAIKWSFEDYQIISIPVVGDINGNGRPEVVINATRVDGGDWPVGMIIALDGRSGQELWRIPHNPANNQYGSHGRSNIALGDVTGNGRLDIVYATRAVTANTFVSHIVAVDGNGQLIWRARNPDGTPAEARVFNGAVTMANFDDDPQAEVVVGGMLIDHDGRVVWSQGHDTDPPLGSNWGFQWGSWVPYRGGVAVVADITGDGKQEILTGRTAWAVDWRPGNPPNVTVTKLWEHGEADEDGYPSIGDFDGDGTPEVVLVGKGIVRILNGRTGQLWCGAGACTQPIEIPGGVDLNRGGPATIADFDGDGRPEIGVAGGHYYVVFDLNRPGEQIVRPSGAPAPAAGQLFVKWMQPTRDRSSNATGSSVFDFQGDGKAEVIYGDECYVRVFDGATGRVILEIQNSNATVLEYPIVVDVDGNGRSEIVVVANDQDAQTHCSSIPGYRGRRGVFVYEDPQDRWVRTRAVWNQHAYSINNINDNGSIPRHPVPSWIDHNTFRANRQGEVPLNAPNPTVYSVSANSFNCPPAVKIQAVITNDGTRGIAAGLPVTLYRIDGPNPVAVATQIIDVPIFPGSMAPVVFDYQVPFDDFASTMDFRVVANDDGTGRGPSYDCDPASAAAEVRGVRCYYTL